jgi:hypothetical protein
MAEPTPQTLRDGRYAVVRTLGEGAQGATLEAVDKKNGRLVAIKRFRVRGAKSWKEVELAEREARVLAVVSHPNLPRYVEHFEEAGELYLVTEKIEGEDLLSLRKRGAMTSEAEVVRFVRDASAALDYLHGLTPPIVHRDIKPSNVLRRPDGSYALIDFGSVRDRMKPEGGSTVVGTFGYMAPEQFQGRAMPVSDVYAVGATAISMLTGREPEDLPHKGLAIDVRAALAGTRVSPAGVEALSAMLEPDPDKRAPRIAPLLAQLGPARGPAPSPRAAAPRAQPQQGQGSARERGRAERHERGRAEGDPRRARKEDERAGKHARKDEKRARHEAERARHEAERARHEAERAAKRARYAHEGAWDRRRGPFFPGPILVLVLIGLLVAQIAVTLVLRVGLPVAFTMVSLIFGKSWREAAKSISNAGKVAVESIDRARDIVRGRAGIETGEPGAPGAEENAREREGAPGEGKRVRVEPGSPGWAKARPGAALEDGEAGREAEAEREAERQAEEQRRRQRKA